MGKTWHIIRREYVERVRKKGFWIGTLLLPIFMVVLTLAPLFLAELSPEKQKKVAIVDLTGRLGGPLQTAVDQDKNLKLSTGKPEFIMESVPADNESLRTVVAGLKRRIAADELYGALVIGDDIEAKGNFKLYGKNVSDMAVLRTLHNKIYDALILVRIEGEKIQASREQLDRILAQIQLDTIQVLEGGGEKKSGFAAAWISTFVFVLVLYMSFLMYGSSIIRGILEEKTSRIMEVLLATFSPFELLMGKILGLALVGLTQVGVYALAFAIVILAGGMGKGMQPEIAEAFAAITPMFALYFAIFFLLGYFLYATLFAGVGSLCNSEQEAQNMQWPLIICLVIPMVSTLFFVQHPDSTLARVISLIPIFTPMVMFMRISTITPPLWEILLSIVLLIAFIIAVTWVASKIFRVAILMYGKRPSPREILRWVRAA